MDAYSAGVNAFPLTLAAMGERVRVVAVGGGQGTDRRLSDLGLTTGCVVTVVSRGSAGSMVVAREDVRLALGVGMAHRVLVTRVEGDDG
jgi:ferrous iron transport protein A